ALADSDYHVRRQAIRLSEPLLKSSPRIQNAVLRLVDDSTVCYQLALSLGEWNDPRAGEVLGKIAQVGMGDTWIRGAVLSSAVPQTAEILKAVAATPPDVPGRSQTVNDLIATAVGQDKPAALGHFISTVVPKPGAEIADWQFGVLKTLMETMERKQQTL